MEAVKDKLIKDTKNSSVLLKAHKLASALYLVTDHLPHQDPLKWRLREQGLEIVSALMESSLAERAADQITKLVSYIDIGIQNRTISEMNLSILKKEYLNLQALLEGEQIEIESGQLPNLPSPKPPIKSIPPKGQSASPRLVNNSRRDSILSFVQNNGWSSIKDISKAVPGVSSKTVQRELADMVRSGLLKKEGDRRWSRYFAI